MAYTITGRKCGTVRIEGVRRSGGRGNGTVKNESLSFSSDVTSNAVESGADINDHVVKKPKGFSITGLVVGDSGEAAKLEAMWDKRDLLTYTGRSRDINLVITALKIDYESQNARGFNFSLTFQKVNISSAQVVPMGEKPLMSQQDAGKATSASTAQGSKQTTQSGLTTVSSATVSSGAYANYIGSYNAKPASSSGPSTRSTPSYNGVS